MKVIIYTDGGSRGNPGPAAIGAVIKNPEGEVLAEISEYIGETTNNQAEYQAIIAALEKACEMGATSADCFLDSMLVVKQVSGEWRIKEPTLMPHVITINNLRLKIGTVTFTHVRREFNKEADAQVNKALDAEMA